MLAEAIVLSVPSLAVPAGAGRPVSPRGGAGQGYLAHRLRVLAAVENTTTQKLIEEGITRLAPCPLYLRESGPSAGASQALRQGLASPQGTPGTRHPAPAQVPGHRVERGTPHTSGPVAG